MFGAKPPGLETAFAGAAVYKLDPWTVSSRCLAVRTVVHDEQRRAACRIPSPPLQRPIPGFRTHVLTCPSFSLSLLPTFADMIDLSKNQSLWGVCSIYFSVFSISFLWLAWASVALLPTPLGAGGGGGRGETTDLGPTLLLTAVTAPPGCNMPHPPWFFCLLRPFRLPRAIWKVLLTYQDLVTFLLLISTLNPLCSQKTGPRHGPPLSAGTWTAGVLCCWRMDSSVTAKGVLLDSAGAEFVHVLADCPSSHSVTCRERRTGVVLFNAGCRGGSQVPEAGSPGSPVPRAHRPPSASRLMGQLFSSLQSGRGPTIPSPGPRPAQREGPAQPLSTPALCLPLRGTQGKAPPRRNLLTTRS